MTEIPPPAPVPLAPELEPDSEPPPADPLPKAQWLRRLKKWGKVAGLVAGIVSAGGSVWKVIDSFDSLRDTIRANEEAVQGLQEAVEELKKDTNLKLGALVSGVRTQREHDRQVVTNLRLAVAAIRAADEVRMGRSGYGGLDSLLEPSEEAEPVPRSPAGRRAQAASAADDAMNALERALKIERATENVDPLAGL